MPLLRPHHALCVQKFTGHGYDPAFTRHMSEVVAALRAAPGTPVLLTRERDELCLHCPNGASGVCTSEEKVRKMDGEVLRLCGLEPGRSLTWGELSAAARERILLTPDFEAVCSCCEWFGLCRETPNN